MERAAGWGDRACGLGSGCHCVGCRRRSERRVGPSSWRQAGGAAIGLAHSKASQTATRGHHTQRRRRERVIAAGLGRFFGITILRNHGDSATSPDAQASDASASTDASASIGGEFDPGSGSTLAACLMHASRARTPSGVLRGGRVRNTWATCPGVGDSRGKPRVIPHTSISRTGGC